MEKPANDTAAKKADGPNHPHDMIFKAVFKRINNVREFLSAQLPAPLLARLNLDTLRLDDTSYSDTKMAEQRADIVLLCDTWAGDPVMIVFILEHKSYVPSFAPFQILQYQTRAWERQLQADKPRPTPVIPAIFYHGQEEWVKKEWQEFLHGWSEEFKEFTPTGGYLLFDLSELSDEAIKRFRSGFMKTTLLLMKHRLEREYLLENLHQIVNFVESDGEESIDNQIDNLRYVLRYLQSFTAIKWEETKTKLHSLKKTVSVMDVLEDIKTEAFQEGVEIGMAQGLARGLERGIERGLERGLEQGLEQSRYFSAFDAIRKGLDNQVILIVLPVSDQYVNEIRHLMPTLPQVEAMLAARGISHEKIAEVCQVPPLFVKAVARGVYNP